LFTKPEGNALLGDKGGEGNDNIKMNLKEIG
jgi:hypothetical protein